MVINEIMPSWGFTYKTVAFNWLKLTGTGKPVKVVGYFFFNSQELCLFGVRGRPTRLHVGTEVKVDSLLAEVRVKHSQSLTQRGSVLISCSRIVKE